MYTSNLKWRRKRLQLVYHNTQYTIFYKGKRLSGSREQKHTTRRKLCKLTAATTSGMAATRTTGKWYKITTDILRNRNWEWVLNGTAIYFDRNTGISQVCGTIFCVDTAVLRVTSSQLHVTKVAKQTENKLMNLSHLGRKLLLCPFARHTWIKTFTLIKVAK